VDARGGNPPRIEHWVRCWRMSTCTRSTTAIVRAGFELTRYADDQVILCRTEREAHAALARLREEMSRCGLTLHAEKTGVVDMSQPGGFDFLGYHFEGNEKRPRRKAS